MGRDQELMRLAFCLYPLPFSLYCPFNSVYGIMSYDRTYRENRRLVTTKSLHDRLGDYLEEIEPIFAKVNGMENERTRIWYKYWNFLAPFFSREHTRPLAVCAPTHAGINHCTISCWQPILAVCNCIQTGSEGWLSVASRGCIRA